MAEAKPKEPYFLEYNKANIFQALVQSETHFRNLKESEHAPDEKGHANCIVKHLAEAEGESSEAISHSLIVEGGEASKKFKTLRDEIKGLREKLQSRGVPPEEGIKEVRRIRRFFEGFNREYDVSSCRACGDIEEVLSKLKIPKTSIAELEEETANHMLEGLAAKYRVPKPKLKLLDACPTEPTHFGLFQKKDGEAEIILCRGSADFHKLAHEFKHYIDHLQEKPISEEEAERFAIQEIEKPLNVEAPKLSHSGEHSMVKFKDVGMIYGGQHIAKGLERGFVEIDKATGKVPPLKAHLRPSTWLNIGLGVGLPLISIFAKLKTPWDELLVLMGGHMSTKVWDYAEEYVAVAPAAYTPAAPGYTPVGGPTPTLGVGRVGKYA